MADIFTGSGGEPWRAGLAEGCVGMQTVHERDLDRRCESSMGDINGLENMAYTVTYVWAGAFSSCACIKE